MSTNINQKAVTLFIIKEVGLNHLTEKAAQKHGISKEQFEEANVDENKYLELDEILNDNDIYQQFATMYVEEQDKKAAAKDEEAKKKEEIQVKDKNGAGV